MNKAYVIVNPLVACIAIGSLLFGLAMKIAHDRMRDYVIHDMNRAGVWERDDLTDGDVLPDGRVIEHWYFTPDPIEEKR